MDPIIKVESLTHVYSTGTPFEMTAIHDVDFQVNEGEFLGIIGQTGSGKSTFIQHLNGLVKPTAGKIFVDGEDINETKEKTRAARFKVGLVFQYPEYQLFEETVEKDIAFGPKNMGLTKDEVRERVREAAGFVGVPEELFDKSPFELSGGQKRRVAIAGVVAMRPKVLILDEPTAGLDPEGCREIIGNVRDYHRQTGATIIMVTHSMEDAAENADRMAVMSGGRIVMDGAPREIFSKSGELRAMGLDVPAITKVAGLLRELGVPVDGSVYTRRQLAEALLSLKGGAANA